MKTSEISAIIKETKIGKIAAAVGVIGFLLGIVAGNLLVSVICVVAAYFMMKSGAKQLSNTFLDGNASGSSVSTSRRIEFQPSKRIGNYFWVDSTAKKWCIPQGKLKKSVYSYTDIMDYELIEDGNSITKGGLGRAVAGGVLFGGVGAIVGGVTGGKKTTQTCSKLQIKIVINDIDSPILYIDLITVETKKDNPVYKNAIDAAQEIIAVLQIMCSETSVE